MLQVSFGLGFGTVCMVIGAYVGWHVSELKNKNDVISLCEDHIVRLENELDELGDQEVLVGFRDNLEEQFCDPD